MSTRRPLTIRGVKTILTRARVPYDDLKLVAHVTKSHVPGREGTIHGVWITGPLSARRACSWALYDAGLTCASYPERDEWARRSW